MCKLYTQKTIRHKLIKENLNKWRDAQCFLDWRTECVQTPCSTHSSEHSKQFQWTSQELVCLCVCLYVCIYVFVDKDLLILKFKLEFKGPRITKIIINKKNQAEVFWYQISRLIIRVESRRLQNWHGRRWMEETEWKLRYRLGKCSVIWFMRIRPLPWSTEGSFYSEWY